MQLKTNKWIVLLLVVIQTTLGTTIDQEQMDSDYLYQDSDSDDTSGYNNEVQENPRKYFFSTVPRAAFLPGEEPQLAGAESTTEVCAESSTAAPAEGEGAQGQQNAQATTAAPAAAAQAQAGAGGAPSPGAATAAGQAPPAGQAPAAGPAPAAAGGTPGGAASAAANPAGATNPTATSAAASAAASGSTSSASSGGGASLASIGAFSGGSNPQSSDQEAKSKELRNLVQHLYIAQARVQLEATEIKKSQAVANVAQQQLEEAASHVRTVTAALQNAQQEVAAAAIRAQTAQLQLAAHDQLLFAARQDVDALSSQMVGLQAAEGISAPRITFDVTGLLEKLKQPLPDEQKPTPVPSVLPMHPTPKPKVQFADGQEFYYE